MRTGCQFRSLSLFLSLYFGIMSDQDHEDYSSQTIQEEQDFFFDDDSVDHEEEFKLSQENAHAAVVVDKEHSFRHMLAGPSTNKVHQK